MEHIFHPSFVFRLLLVHSSYQMLVQCFCILAGLHRHQTEGEKRAPFKSLDGRQSSWLLLSNSQFQFTLHPNGTARKAREFSIDSGFVISKAKDSPSLHFIGSPFAIVFSARISDKKTIPSTFTVGPLSVKPIEIRVNTNTKPIAQVRFREVPNVAGLSGIQVQHAGRGWKSYFPNSLQDCSVF